MQAETLRSQLTRATAEAAEAKANEETSSASVAELKKALEKQQEPAVRLSNPQARHTVSLRHLHALHCAVYVAIAAARTVAMLATRVHSSEASVFKVIYRPHTSSAYRAF